MSISLCRDKLTHFVIGSLPRVLYTYPAIAQELVPYIIHDALLSEFHKTQQTRLDISNVFNQAFRSSSKDTIPHLKLIINCILYLRFQQLPNESNVDDRDFWLDIDYMSAAMAASLCQMPKTALLFVEIHHSHLATGSRRNSAVSTNPLNSQLLHDVFQAIGDPDLPYGLEQDSSLEAMLHSLSHDGNPLQKLTLLSASHDADVRLRQGSSSDGSLEFVKALNETNLQGLAQNMLSNPGAAQGDGQDQGILLSTALYLQQWDIPIPSSGTSPMGEVFNIFKSLNTLGDKRQICHLIDDSFLGVFNELAIRQTPNSFQKHLQALGILGEIDGIVSSGSQNLLSQWERIMSRNEWLKYESLDNIKHMLYCREALFSSLSREGPLQSCVNGDGRLTRQLEFKTIQESLRVYKEHDDLQAAMKSAVSLTKLIPSCRKQGLLVDAAAQFEFAQVLWHQGEMSRSIQLLQQLRTKDLRPQSIEVDQARLLATLGHHIFEAREGGAETVRVDYLTPAGRILDHSKEARQKDAGVVYHEFAVFCDRYVSHPDGIAEFKRVQQTWSRRNQEIIELEYEAENATGAQKQRNAVLLKKANQWFELDDAEYERQKESREHFVVNAIENYLKSLSDCDIYKDDVLRFCALWLDNYSNVAVCAAVEKHLNSVPSYRFAPLVSQLCSRLLDVDDTFQSHLSALMQRICVDHPYHGMYQVFMSSKSRIGEDAASKSRCRAANKVADAIKTKRELWVRLHNANVMYHRFATEPLNEKARAGTKAYLKKTEAGQFLERDIPSSKLPPPTMRIELRRNCDYSDVPVVTSYLPQYSIASGVSAPKIATAIASDGLRYKQLFKGGNDDLRQDQIMEQVFEQVSGLLREHRDTRQRQLAIRTYKVVPITANTGVIEFVQNTIPLNDYLLPAHVSHFPRDMSYRNARELITKVQSKSLRERVKTYMHVTNNFHPVLRFFFMERFLNPDDWFKKRLAYTRSTAAISILGHILGLGDRHGHNILLDERTGEVVHIDLGVAFEQGRVLPIPEVVPFRLTRDLVDGMGITKTKGVFARCCEFTLDALRQESYSIMTILDVLRYDPLYSWSLSPVRAKKMQDEEKRGKLVGSDANDNANEPSEADRALTVVAKKLEKSLSVSTTVNELIRQATDVNNLAVLYSGWAAFA
ncbi:Serine/threonine-protein kinase tel1 [Ascosphaera atra]|nr:Serine/threonine-protein kinase tel1 [Ascosphaera atra]